MEESYDLPGTHVTPAPSGLLLACLVDQTLRICYARVPEQSIDFPIRCPASKVRALSWAQDSSKVTIQSSAHVEVVNLEDDKDRVRIDNGTAGFGRFEHAELLDRENLFTVWEYGRGKIWNLTTGRTTDLDSVKTLTPGCQYAIRRSSQQDASTLAYISRPGAEDLISVNIQGADLIGNPRKMSTADAQFISWSPDGKWITVLDSPQYSPSVFLFTPDGHLFRSFPGEDTARDGLGVKAVTWSPDSQHIALSNFSNIVEIVSPRTMSVLGTMRHSTTLNQGSGDFAQTIVWQETASAAGERTYTAPAQAVSPPISQKASSDEPQKLGITNAIYSCDGKFLASIDGRMLSTIWIWDVEHMQTRAVAIQHSNIKRAFWHASLPGLLLLDCGENKVYLWDLLSDQPPTCMDVYAASTLSFTFMPSHSNTSFPAILATSRESFRILYPYGRGEASRGSAVDGDSIFEALSGGHDTSTFDESITQRIAHEADLDDGTARVNDTFNIARKKNGDPFDDSEIF